MKILNILCIFFAAATLSFQPLYAEISAKDLIQKSMDQWRGESSYSEVSMTIVRKDWRRKMQMKAWTQGEDASLVRVIEPKADAGSGTLMKGKKLWTYSPKINRVIKIPSSMMGQGWMGSDFSNRDISRSTEIINSYQHELVKTYNKQGKTFYEVESIPNEDAAIVWGKEVITLRDDYIILRHEFWDQQGVLVKLLEATEIKTFGGRPVASKIRMGKVAYPDEWTEMETLQIEFDLQLQGTLFSLSNLRNPRSQ